MEAQRAETEAETLRSWNSLYTSYQLYRHCDDGAIAEGYDESVARILVDHWETLPRLNQIGSRHLSFRNFVLKHVGGTMDLDDLKKIGMNATDRCPSGLRSLCNDLKKGADAP